MPKPKTKTTTSAGYKPQPKSRADLLAAHNVERRSFDRPVFAARHGFSNGSLNRIIEAGNGPHETRIGSRVIITDKAEQASGRMVGHAARRRRSHRRTACRTEDEVRRRLITREIFAFAIQREKPCVCSAGLADRITTIRERTTMTTKSDHTFAVHIGKHGGRVTAEKTKPTKSEEKRKAEALRNVGIYSIIDTMPFAKKYCADPDDADLLLAHFAKELRTGPPQLIGVLQATLKFTTKLTATWEDIDPSLQRYLRALGWEG